MKVYLSSSFGKKIKKFNKKEKLELDKEIQKIIKDPALVCGVFLSISSISKKPYFCWLIELLETIWS
jgi:hypothetical protein